MLKSCGSTDTLALTQQAISSAMRMLAIREHSQKQLGQKLLQKGFEREIVNSCIGYLLENDLLSDTRFCNVFIRSKAEKGLGLQRILSELTQQEISQSIIEQQLASERIDWQLVCNRVLTKKLFTSNRQFGAREVEPKRVKLSFKQYKKIENFLRYRGFTIEEIKSSTKQYIAIEY